MAGRTTMTQAVQLTEPIREKPRPAAGCDVCKALAGQWRQAMEVGGPAYDPSHATDLAVEIQRHPHGRHR
jgi:hypothetical protein